MPFNIDSYRIFRAIQAAGIDPNDTQQVERFTRAIIEQVQQVPAERRANFSQRDWNRVVDLAADQVAASPGMEELRARGQANDPTSLWELTELGKRGRERRAATNGAPSSRPANPIERGDNFTPPSGQTIHDTFTQDTEPRVKDKFKPQRIDPNELWRQAREQGKI